MSPADVLYNRCKGDVMQVTGCDFLCENPTCDGFGCKITIHGSWPIGDITSVIKAETDGDRLNALFSRQGQGRTHALLIMPAMANIEPSGIRIQLYCSECKVIWDKDFTGLDFKEEAERYLTDEEKICEQCEGEVVAFREAMDDPIKCPMCEMAMNPVSWMTKGSSDGDQGSCERQS
jgi:hypothetical protein